MVKHTQAIFWQTDNELFSVLDHFVGLTLKGLIYALKTSGFLKFSGGVESEHWHEMG